MHTPTRKPTGLEVAQAQFAGFVASSPVIQGREPAWHPGLLTSHQQSERVSFEEAMRAGQLRRMPTVFGGLDEVPAC